MQQDCKYKANLQICSRTPNKRPLPSERLMRVRLRWLFACDGCSPNGCSPVMAVRLICSRTADMQQNCRYAAILQICARTDDMMQQDGRL